MEQTSDKSFSLTDVSYYNNPGWTPRDAANQFAYDRHRRICNFRAHAKTEYLAGTFAFIGGNNVYVVRFDDARNAYEVGRIN
jgi:hypothetical protein